MKLFCKGWKFLKGDIKGAHLNEFDDSDWRTVNLPHDWSVEGEFDKEKGEGNTAYLLGGLGWYRKTFKTTDKMKDGSTTICFDGIYNNADVYINGKYLGFHPYGYSPFNYDISEYLKELNDENVIAVRVDHTRYADSRWYTGSGIYRNVKLDVAPLISIPVWGVSITTPIVEQDKALVKIETEIQNKQNLDKNIKIEINLLNKNADIVSSISKVLKFQNESSKIIENEFIIESPNLWSIDNPYLYSAKIDVIIEDKIIQTQTYKFGIREFYFDINKGFYLNGQHEYIKGVCLHHEAGLVGAAVPKDVWRKRLQVLRECGCNAIRTAHNPASEEFLEVCDEMGFLVQEEFFDEWDNPKDKRGNGTEKTVDYITRGYCEFFKDWAKEDVQNTILRDRNHPCVFQWSLGNEIEWTYPKYNYATGYFGADARGNYFWTLPPHSLDEIRENIHLLPEDRVEIGKTAKKLSKWVKEIDTTRPVIANCILPSASYESGYTDALDMVGYSYRRVVYDYGHKNYPDKPIMGTENVAQWHEWKAVLERPFISGLFLWTGFDYLGEAGIAHRSHWPVKGSSSGLIDCAGFPKQSYYMMKSLWNEEPSLHIATQLLDKSLYKLSEENKLIEKKKDSWKHRLWGWQDVNSHWKYETGDKVVVEIYSNCDEIELMLNDKSYGKKQLADFEDHIYKWLLPYEEGCLKAIGYKNQDKVSEEIFTEGRPSEILVSLDKKELTKEGEVVQCIAQLYDETGHIVTLTDKTIEFLVEGNIRVLGVDNGSLENVSPYQSLKCKTASGHCLLFLQATEPGEITLTAKTDNFVSEKSNIVVDF